MLSTLRHISTNTILAEHFCMFFIVQILKAESITLVVGCHRIPKWGCTNFISHHRHEAKLVSGKVAVEATDLYYLLDDSGPVPTSKQIEYFQ
jgi:hypothetical protein